MRNTILVLWLLCLSTLNCLTSFSQSCFSTGLNGQSINVPCSTPCITLNLQINDLKSSSDYTISNIPFAPPRPFTSGGEDASNYIDDRFTIAYNTFPTCFYDSVFNNFLLGSNGVLTFDISNAT